MKNSFRIPKGWYVTGDVPEKYEIRLDPTLAYENHPCVTLKSSLEPIAFAALAQMIKAEVYRGKRFHFSAEVRPKELENRAAVFMRKWIKRKNAGF